MIHWCQDETNAVVCALSFVFGFWRMFVAYVMKGVDYVLRLRMWR